MHSSKRHKTLTNYLSSRLTPDEEERIKVRAEETGVTKSEWCRQAILSCLETPLSARLILAELMSLRKILLALKLDEIHSQIITEDRLRLIVEQAEVSKFAMAENRIHSFRSSSNEPK